MKTALNFVNAVCNYHVSFSGFPKLWMQSAGIQLKWNVLNYWCQLICLHSKLSKTGLNFVASNKIDLFDGAGKLGLI
jgi:hypothetical protein